MRMIREYLKEIIPDENQIDDFVRNNETEIKASLGKIWKTYSLSHSKDTQADENKAIEEISFEEDAIKSANVVQKCP
jgi:hypothetical protein